MMTREAHVLSPGNALPGGSVVPLLLLGAVDGGGGVVELGLLVGVTPGERMTVGVMRWACIEIVLPLVGAVVFVGSIPGVDPKAEVDRLSEVRFPVSKGCRKKALATSTVLPPIMTRSESMSHLDDS